VEGFVANGEEVARLKRAIATFLKEADIQVSVQVERELDIFKPPQ
jgi:hypothetical protein